MESETHPLENHDQETPPVTASPQAETAEADHVTPPKSKAGAVVDSLRHTLADSLSFLGPTWEKVQSFFSEQRKTISLAVVIALALLVLALVSGVLGIINAIPLLPAVLELLGLWYILRYLLMAESRKAVVQELSEFISKVTGQQS
ncbi:MAG: CAAD domain-containing protein [Gloeomargarita sp. SKYG116]|nr:CAAD domain-containing protein [Gloeomargarita sp. SKYG116]MCS7293736.1 CAAD domain-containing protein [Gloeomargarita sp. SKYB120]MDW8179302.1 CAAD domain-containing protein [Gloeomargarita sp. SKYBB_i_bin120]MDW8400181.1 CAAD domain-containing protein [Gloeomargarita sp. SKYGB_i_bin116]